MTDQPTFIVFPASHKGTHYYLSAPNGLSSQTIGDKWAALDTMTGPQLVTLHNLVVSNLGGRPTKKFADNAKAVARTWKALQDYQQDVDDYAMGAEELDAQKPRAEVQADKAPEPAPAVVLSDADKKQIADEAASRKPAAKRGSQAGTIRKPRAPKPDDGAIRMPTEGGKQRAKRQKDGSYAFRIPAGKPRTQTVSPEREELLGLLVGDGATWADIVAQLNKQDDANNFKAVTTVTMFCITLGYGLETQPDGTIKLLEPVA